MATKSCSSIFSENIFLAQIIDLEFKLRNAPSNFNLRYVNLTILLKINLNIVSSLEIDV